MDLNESLFSRVKHRVGRPLLTRSLSDSGPEEARDADGESSESGTPRRASYDSLLIPETPSPVLQRCKNKREREVQSSQGEEDSDSKRSRAMMKNFDRFVSPFKPADIKNKEKKEAFEKLRIAREKRLAKIESDSDHEGEGATSPSSNGYKYAHFGTGYLGWPSESDSDSDDNDDDIPLRSILNVQKVKGAEIGETSDCNKTKSAIPNNFSVMRQIKEAVNPNDKEASVAPDMRFTSAAEVRLKTEPQLEVENSSIVEERQNLSEFVSPGGERPTLYKDKNASLKLEENQQNSAVYQKDEDKSVSEEAKHVCLPVNRRRNLFPKKDVKVKNRPSLFENRSDLNRAASLQRPNSHNPLLMESESRPSCRFPQNSSFRPASSLLSDRGGNCGAQVSMNDTLGSPNNDSVILFTPPVHRGGNSQACSLSESSFLNQLPPGGQKSINADRAEPSNISRKNGCYSNHLSFNLPPGQESLHQNTSEFATPPQVRNDMKPNIVHTIDLTRSESPTFFSPGQSHPLNGMHSGCRFRTPTHDVSRCDTNRVESVQPVSLNMPGPQRSPSPDIIPLGVFNLSANRRAEFDLSVSPQPMRNRTGSRRHNRVAGLRRNRMGNINTDEGISPTTTRLMSEVSVSNHGAGNDADEAVSMVRQMEDDEQYARRLQEEMDKEFALSLHQADAGFVQTDHAGAFGAEEAACPPALSPSFLQYCRSPVRRRGYNSNRQPINRRRRGAAAAEPEDLTTYEDLIVDGPGYEHVQLQHSGRRFPPGANHPLALMEAHILALLDSSPVNRRGRRRGSNGGRFLRNLHSPVGDGNDYEELLELAESLGEVKQKGMTKSELNRLATRKYKSSEASRDETTDCLICMCDYQDGDKLRILPCCHEFHQPCIDKWLKNMATCPICRVDVKNS